MAVSSAEETGMSLTVEASWVKRRYGGKFSKQDNWADS